MLNGLQLREVFGGIRLKVSRPEVLATQIGAQTFVVGEVALSAFDVVCQVFRCLLNGDPKGLHQVASVYVALPIQSKLNELVTSFDVPIHSLFIAPSTHAASCMVHRPA